MEVRILIVGAITSMAKCSFIVATFLVLITANSLAYGEACRGTEHSGQQSTLVVLAPSINQTTVSWQPLIEKLQNVPDFRPDEAYWLCFDHNIGALTVGDIEEYARELRANIDGQWQKAGGYDKVVLIGHSIGGLLVRQAYLLAAGADAREIRRSQWGDRVTHIVLFAAMNRGIDDKSSRWRRLAAWSMRTLPIPHLIMEDVLRGSDFVTNLRVNWIRHFAKLTEDAKQRASEGQSVPLRLPAVVQFLGTRDELVSREDSKDLLAFPNGQPIDIPEAYHGDPYQLDKANDPDARYSLIKNGILNAKTEFSMIDPTSDVRDVVFILHGIRASNNDQWVQQLESKIRDKGGDSVHVVPPGYGYFSAARFALPSVRKRNIRWFQDRYTETFARFPHARYHFIGHSNGTYIFGQSLRKIAGMKFDHVVLAGSVLPSKYPWGKRVAQGQVKQVRNDRANKDFPVAVLCSALRALFMRDVGTGGFSGFEGASTYEVAYYPGGHGAALDDNNLDHLVNFALEGARSRTSLPGKPGYYQQLSNLAPYLAWVLVIITIYGVYRLVRPDGSFSFKRSIIAASGLFALYVLLDVI